MSRLEFGPRPKEMEVTDIATGHFVFRPVAGKEVSFPALEEAIEDAGYEIEDATITLAGVVTDERHLTTPNGQVFHLTAADDGGKQRLEGLRADQRIVVTGAWTAVEGVDVVVVSEVEPAAGAKR
ncbi:MAG TPA: hypothetical protein VM617_07995 [Thermoanaerobaculia bacterium]|nr:hypothetical protein [Thermoanaerobaculia bacterium]